jgi:hypothetical protein
MKTHRDCLNSNLSMRFTFFGFPVEEVGGSRSNRRLAGAGHCAGIQRSHYGTNYAKFDTVYLTQ